MADEMDGSGPMRDPAVQKKFDAAMKAMDAGDFKKAYSAFKKFSAEFPDDAEGWFYTAECGNYASGMFGVKVKPEEIMEDYRKAIELGGNADYYQAYGQFCISVGKYDEAEKSYNEAAEIDSSMAPTYYSEFAIEYYNNMMAVYADMAEDPKAAAALAPKKKALEYLLKAIDMTPEEAKSLL